MAVSNFSLLFDFLLFCYSFIYLDESMLVLSVDPITSLLFFRDFSMSEWFINGMYSGPTDVFMLKDLDGRWFLIQEQFSQQCLGIRYIDIVSV